MDQKARKFMQYIIVGIKDLITIVLYDPAVGLQTAKKGLNWNQHERNKENENLIKDNNIHL